MATPVAVVHTQTAPPFIPINTPIRANTPSSYKTATSVAKFSDNDIGYFQDLYPCLALDEAASKAMKDLTYTIQTRAIRDETPAL